MLENIPLPLVIASLLIALTTVVILITALRKATHPTAGRRAKHVAIALGLWTIAQIVLGYNGVYRDYTALPPRIFLFGVFPAFIAVFWAAFSKGSRAYIQSLPLEILTWLHTIRIPVEIGLLQLYLHHAVPQLMTFEGRNFDILSGLTAPIVAYLLRRKTISRPLLIIWNLLALGLLANIVINAILATPFPFQQWGFEQPNIAIFYFPFVLLPTVIVPVVLFAHCASLVVISAQQKTTR